MADRAGRVEIDGLPELLRKLRKFEPEANKELRAELRGIGNLVASDAKARASWSSRIPASIGVSVTGKGVAVKARKSRAPHARVYEKGGRHPLFGNRNFWFPVKARPFLKPAVDANRDNAVRAVEQAIARTARKLDL